MRVSGPGRPRQECAPKCLLLLLLLLGLLVVLKCFADPVSSPRGQAGNSSGAHENNGGRPCSRTNVGRAIHLGLGAGALFAADTDGRTEEHGQCRGVCVLGDP